MFEFSMSTIASKEVVVKSDVALPNENVLVGRESPFAIKGAPKRADASMDEEEVLVSVGPNVR